MTHDVFICHSSGDKLTADAACNVLEAKGIRCWIAPRDILPGVPYAEGILQAIAEVKVFLIVFSSRANASNQVSKEVERAVHRGIPIIPLRIEDVVPTRSLEYFISESHWLDAITPPLQRHLDYLTEVIERLLSGEDGAASGAPSVKAAPPRQTRRGLKYWQVAAGGAAILLAIAAAVGLLFRPPQKQVVTSVSASHQSSAMGAVGAAVVGTWAFNGGPGCVADNEIQLAVSGTHLLVTMNGSPAVSEQVESGATADAVTAHDSSGDYSFALNGPEALSMMHKGQTVALKRCPS